MPTPAGRCPAAPSGGSEGGGRGKGRPAGATGEPSLSPMGATREGLCDVYQDCDGVVAIVDGFVAW